jgi:hypothetical protein
VVAGTATAVSGRVARRQAEKYADRDAAIYAEREQAYQQQVQPQAPPQQVVYAAPPEQAYAPPPPPPAPEPEPAASGNDDIVSQLQQLGQLKAQGILTDEEFAAAKAKLLGG